MKKLLLLAALPLLALSVTVQLNPKQWTLYGFGLKNLPKGYGPKAYASGFQVQFPDAKTGDWAGYLLPNRSAYSLTTADTLVMTAQLLTTAPTTFNFNSEPSNTCPSPAHFRPYIQSGQSFADGTRWWSSPQAFLLDQSVAGLQTTLVLPLDPSQWSGVYGEFANQDATTLANFQQSLSSITYIGLTAGGGCFFGHGVNTSGGTATFQVLDIHTF